MKRNCNLELRLHSTYYDHGHHQPMVDWWSGSPKEEEEEEQQQLTIFYNGRVNVCDVTELQAKAIIMLASRETEEKIKSPSASVPASPSIQSQLHSPNTLSMKRSLQRFLQKRKNRILETSPYNH